MQKQILQHDQSDSAVETRKNARHFSSEGTEKSARSRRTVNNSQGQLIEQIKDQQIDLIE